MRTFVVSTFALLLLTSVAFPQQSLGPGENANSWADKQNAAAARAAVEHQKQKELDAQYKASLGTMKKPIAPSDPWADVRPTQTAPAAKKKQQ
jgi:hypothetical protein